MNVRWLVASKNTVATVWESKLALWLRGLVARNAKAIIPTVGPLMGLLVAQRLGLDLPVSIRDQIGTALALGAIIWLAPKNKPPVPPIVG